jgi:hypothetical protein
VAVHGRLDSGFYGARLLDQMDAAGVTYLCGMPLSPRSCKSLTSALHALLDKDVGEVAEFGYRMREGRRFRRYIVKRIPDRGWRVGHPGRR